jgi:hypothetical protein
MFIYDSFLLAIDDGPMQSTYSHENSSRPSNDIDIARPATVFLTATTVQGPG